MIVNECITGQDKKAYEQKLGEDLSTDKILDEEYQLIKKHLFSSPNSRLLMDSKLSFEGIVCTWVASTPNLTGSQKELNRELLNIVKGLDPCYYDQKEDRHCEYYIEKLKNFLQSNKNNQDLKTVLNLRRGESGLTVLHLVSSVGKVTQGYNETVDLLLEAGANPNIQSDKGRTPLHYTDVLANAASLLKGKANPNIQDHRGETPLHHAASIGHADYVNLLLEKKANPTIQNRKGETPLQVAIDNRYYYIEECFFTNDQKSLSAQLYCILDKYFSTYEDCIWSKDEDRSGYAANLINLTKNLKEFLGKHKNSEDLKVIFSIRDIDGNSKILNYARYIDKEVVDLFLSVGAGIFCKKEDSLLDCHGSFYSVGEKYCVKSTLWNTPSQVELDKFLSKISEVQDMYKLEEVVNKAISSGVRIALSNQSSQGKKAYNFVDHVIEKISKLEKNPKVASNIICKLVSRGAVFNSKIGIGVIDALESEFNDHKANMVKAHENYISNAHKFTIDSKGVVRRIKGIAHPWRPSMPRAPSGQLLLCYIHQTWKKGEGVKIVNNAIHAVPMNELEAMKKGINDLYALVAQERLRNDANSREPTTKKGVFVDPFFDDDMRDQGVSQSAAIVNKELILPIDVTIADIDGEEKTYLLPYELEPVLEQLLQTKGEKINPYQAFDPVPAQITLNKNIDHWTEVTTNWKSPVTRVFNTRETTELLSSNSYETEFMREAVQNFEIEGFEPNEKLKEVKFDGIFIQPTA